MTPDDNDHKERESAMPRHAKRQRNDLEDNDDGLLQIGDIGIPYETKPIDRYSETFPEKLMKIIDDERALTSIRWSSDGTVFGIHPTEFEAEVMSKHFRSSKLASFIRRLSRWGFERAVGDEFPVEWIVYRHPLFRRGQASLLKHLTTGHMDEVNAIKEEKAGNSNSDNAYHPRSLTANHLIALGSESQVVSRADGQTPPGYCVEDHMMQKMERNPARLTVNNDGPIVGLLRSQGMQQALASNPSLPAQHPMLGGISQNSFDDMLLRNLSFDQLMQMNSQLENRRLLSLLQSQSLSNASNNPFLPIQPTPWLHSNLLVEFEMNQQQNRQLSDQELYRYLLYRQNRG